MKNPVLSIFADGVRHDSLRYMPFVSRLNSVPLETVLGYSITCHPSMYTGVYPDKHKIAFHWVKSEKKYGPYSLLSFFPDVFPFSNSFVQAVCSHFYAKFFLKSSAFMGYSKVLNLPMKFWHLLDINEFKYWDEENYINDDVRTIFELVRERGLTSHISKIHKPNLGKIDYIEVVNPKNYDWVYYFVGELDGISHSHTQHSQEGKKLLLKLDSFVKDRYQEFEKEHSDFTFIFWSDHGHIPIDTRYNLYEEFEKHRINLKKIFHIIDSTTARFWPETDSERNTIQRIMREIPEANLVSSKEYLELHLPEEENLYGKLFYYLNGGAVFTHTIHGFGLKTQSMHGYHPKANGNAGLFASNKPIKQDQATLPDVFATSIKKLGIKYIPKAGLDGKNILS